MLCGERVCSTKFEKKHWLVLVRSTVSAVIVAKLMIFNVLLGSEIKFYMPIIIMLLMTSEF